MRSLPVNSVVLVSRMSLYRSSRLSRSLFRLGRFPQLTPAFSYSTDNIPRYDVVIVGGGIVGVASARELLVRYPQLKVALLEKERKLAAHQTGHNSGVIHAGIYYKPGSLKAKLCVEGMHLAYDYLDKNNIPYKKCGKLIVATRQSELKALDDLHDRGTQNNVPDLKMIDGSKIKEIEPHCEGVRALWSPHTGIVDWGLVTHHYSADFRLAGGKIYLDFEVNRFREVDDPEYPIEMAHKDSIVRTKYVLACCGLQSDLVAVLSGCKPDPKIIPFRGEYLLLHPSKTHLVNGNIYPVPDARFPFLGVHFTPRMDGSILLGPNAVLALSREGYKWGDINLRELSQIIQYPGFRKMAMKYTVFGMKEMLRSAFSSLQVKELQRYIPVIQPSDIMPGPSGVRAQAMGVDGSLIEDFIFDTYLESGIGSRVLHVRNAPSPGATSSLAIAKMINDKLAESFGLNK